MKRYLNLFAILILIIFCSVVILPKSLQADNLNISVGYLFAIPALLLIIMYAQNLGRLVGEDIEKEGWIRQNKTSAIDAILDSKVKIINEVYVYLKPDQATEVVTMLKQGEKIRILKKTENDLGSWYRVKVKVKEYYYSTPPDYEVQLYDAEESYFKRQKN